MSDLKRLRERFRDTIITGVNTWGGVSQVNDTQVDVGAGDGFIINPVTNRLKVTKTRVTWVQNATFTVTMPTDFGVQQIYIDSAGVIQQQSTVLTRLELKTKIFLFSVEFLSGVISGIVAAPKFIQSSGTILTDFFQFQPDSEKLKGAAVLPVDNMLQAFRDAGAFFEPGINNATDPNDANVAPIAADGNSTTPFTYAILLRDGTLDSSGVSTFPKERNSTGSTVVALTGKKATIHYYAVLGSVNLLLMGQNEYADASAAAAKAEFDFNNIVFPAGFESAIILAQIVIGNDASNFNDPAKARILNLSGGGNAGSVNGGNGTAALPDGYINGLKLTFKTVATIDIEAGNCRDDADSRDVVLASPVTLTLSAAGAGGLDTGSESSNALYYIWVIDDSADVNAVSGIFSLSDTTPTIPAGYDKKRLIGAVRNGSTSNLFEFIAHGTGKARRMYYDEGATPLQVLSGGSATSFTNVDVSALVPSMSQRMFARCSYQRNFSGGTDDAFMVRPDGSTEASPIIRVGGMFDDVGSSNFTRLMLPIELSTAQIFEYLVANNNNALQLFLSSYEFEL